MTNIPLLFGANSGSIPVRRLCLISVLILSMIPMIACGRSRVRRELRLNRYFADILNRTDRRLIGEDGFFEDNLLSNPNPDVRQWCAVALARIGSPAALPLLYKAAHAEDAAVRAASAFAVGAIEDREVLGAQYRQPDPQAAKEMLLLLDDTSIGVRMRATEALGRIGSDAEAREILRRFRSYGYDGSLAGKAYAEHAITALVRLKYQPALPVLERLADEAPPEIQWRAIDALARLQDQNACPLFLRQLENPDTEIRAYATSGLASLKKGAIEDLVPMLAPVDSRTGKPVPLAVRCAAIQAMGEIKDAGAIPAIKAAIESEPVDDLHPDQQNFAIQASAALAKIGSADAVPLLASLIRSTQPVANSSAVALAGILKGEPQRFFEIVERSRYCTSAALPAWTQAMAQLGGDGVAAELGRVLAEKISAPAGSRAEIFSAVLNSLAKTDAPGLQQIILPLLDSKNLDVLRAAIQAYKPEANAKEPWLPLVRAFANCDAGGNPAAKIEILMRLSLWAGEPKVQPVFWTGLKDRDRSIRLASLSLLHRIGTAAEITDPGPSNAAASDVYPALASSRKYGTIAAVETNRGTVEIELFREDAPLTVSDFVNVAKRGDYNGFVFRQVNPAQWIGGNEAVSRNGFLGTNAAEIGMRPFERGCVGMTAGPGRFSRGGLFITLSPQPYFDGIHACFGRVVGGIQVADRIVPGDRIVRIDIKETISSINIVRY